MADVAVVAHAGKSLGGGLPELREILAREGVTDPLALHARRPDRLATDAAALRLARVTKVPLDGGRLAMTVAGAWAGCFLS
jgi:hypothetical protein